MKITDLKNKLVDVCMFLYVISLVLSYTELNFKMSIIRIVLQLIIIGACIWFVDFKSYVFLFPLIAIIVVWPLILMLLGVYNIAEKQIIEYGIYFIFSIFFIVCVADKYQTNITSFIKVWFFSLNTSLILLWIVFKGLSLNVIFLFNAMLSNQRYGDNLLAQRYGMGFLNVNTLALFATLLILTVILLSVNRKYLFFLTLDAIWAVLLILNAESRTPIIILMATIFFIIIQSLKKQKIKKLLNFIFFGAISTFSLFFLWMLSETMNSSHMYGYIDELSSYRLSFGTQAINFVREHSSTLVGVGPMSTSYLTTAIFGETIKLDNSFEYYLFSIGWIGLIVVYGFYIWLMKKVSQAKNVKYRTIGLVVTIFYFVYSIFENDIFIPNSPLSQFCLVVVFIVFQQVSNEETER